MTVYAIVALKITNEEKYKLYAAGVAPFLMKYECQCLAADLEPTVLEGDWPYTRTVILSFPDMERLNGWYNDPEYKELAKYRWESSTAQVAVLKGFEPQE